MMRNLNGSTFRGRYFITASLSITLLIVFYTLSFQSSQDVLDPRHYFHSSNPSSPKAPWSWPKPNESVPPIPCVGPRGRLLNDSKDDQLRPLHLDNVTYPEPMMGSYEALGIEKTWFSTAGRYGPYGFGEAAAEYDRVRVDWGQIQWGALQDQCAQANEVRLPNLFSFSSEPRFAYRSSSWRKEKEPRGFDKTLITPRSADEKTGRQAIVIRSWSTYEWTEDDFHNLRSIITEAALAKGATYAVFILVDVKDLSLNIHKNATAYQAELHRAVPAEFRDMAVLFDESLLKSWYPKAVDYRPIVQIMQPFQLFAHFYPEFDHYWQIESDTRFMGHTGDMLNAFHDFGRAQPRKQSAERATWNYIPRSHGTYAEFTSRLNTTMKGNAGIWGPVRIGDEINPIGPAPPTPNPQDDDFTWGVGEDADYLLAATLQDVRRMEDWVFDYWHYGFTLRGADLPWWMSTPAQGRASWNLLNACHHAQAVQDLRVHSEATLPSFALWHGLKVVGLPIPVYQDPARDRGEMEFVLNGGGLDAFDDGIAMGPSNYRAASLRFFVVGRSFDWTSPMPDLLMRYWKREQVVDESTPGVLLEHEGEILSPNMLLHPRKTNYYRSDKRK